MVKEAIEKIKEELKDIRYEGKTSKEIADMLNAPVIVTTTEQRILPNRRTQLLSPLLMTGNITNASLKGAILSEITNDPLKLGYSGKRNGQVNTILDKVKTEEIKIETQYPPKIYQILIGIANAPNFVTEEDIIEILKESEKYIDIVKVYDGKDTKVYINGYIREVKEMRSKTKEYINKEVN